MFVGFARGLDAAVFNLFDIVMNGVGDVEAPIRGYASYQCHVPYHGTYDNVTVSRGVTTKNHFIEVVDIRQLKNIKYLLNTKYLDI